MKKLLLFFSVCLLAVVGIGAVVQQTTGIYILAPADQVQLKIRSTVAQTKPWLEMVDRGTVKFSMPATGLVPLTYGGTGLSASSISDLQLKSGIHSGTVTTADDGTVTNTFSPIFSASPVVVAAQTGSAVTVSNILTVTKSNFVFNAGAPAIAVKWVAVGAP